MKKPFLYLLPSFFFASSVLAANNGINSSSDTPLPLGAGGNVAMTILPSGNVGIGTETPQAKLDVDGAIKIGRAESCDASHVGEIRWNGSLFQGCDGAEWIVLGGLPSGSLCGSIFWETRDNGYCGIQQSYPCQGSNIMLVCGTVTCPAGFYPVPTGYSWGSTNGYAFAYNFYSCMKK